MPQFTATSVLWLSIENRFLNGPASQLPASWNHDTMSFDEFASKTISRIATTRMPTTTAVAARTTPASNNISLPTSLNVLALKECYPVGRPLRPRPAPPACLRASPHDLHRDGAARPGRGRGGGALRVRPGDLRLPPELHARVLAAPRGLRRVAPDPRCGQR